MALDTITLHGEILAPVTGTPAVGTVTFKILHDLRDTVANVIYSPQTFVATLDLNGEFSIVLPVTDDPDITPLDWTYWVYVDTDVWTSGVFYMALPSTLGPVAEFADIIPILDESCTPDGTACAPISVMGQVTALEEAVDDLQDEVTDVVADVSALEIQVNQIASAYVISVNGDSGIVVLNAADVGADPAGSAAAVLAQLMNSDAAWITSGTLDYQRLGGTIAEALTVVFNRATLVNPGTAADSWQFTYNGVRVTYMNEYMCLRVRGIPDTQVPARFMSHFTWDGTTQPTFQVSLANGTSHMFQVLPNGDILSIGGLSMLPTAPQPVVFTGLAASAALISDGAATGAPYTLSTTLQASNNRVFMDGAVVNGGGAPIAGGTVLFTVTLLHRPTAWVQFTGRTSTTLSTRGTLKPNGTFIIDQPLAAGATLSLDGYNYRKN